MRAVVLLFLVALATASSSKVTPVQKVLQLMDGLIEKGKTWDASRHPMGAHTGTT